MGARAGDRASSAVGGGPESIGPLLTRLRLARGYTQLLVAERLRATSGLGTVTRHEVSRWEREERLPGQFWLTWLAVVLEAPLAELEAAVARARVAATTGSPPPDPQRLWRPVTATQLLAELDQADPADLHDLVHAWLAAPDEPALPGSPVAGGRWQPVTTDTGPLDALEAKLADHRRMDDLVGGLALAGPVDRGLRTAIELFGGLRGSRVRRRALLLIAEYAQLAGWVHADAGEHAAARRAYRLGLRAATAGGDRALAAHVLGSLSQLLLTTGDPREALLLARSGQAGARPDASPGTRALLLHRVALAAAAAGERRAAYAALTAADRAADQSDPDREPRRLYWLDPAELSAMTGRCWAVLGRPLRAIRLLAGPRPGVGPRTAAIYAGWLARCYLAVGEIETACRVARRALRDAIRAGSVRAAAELRQLRPLLLRHRDLPAVRHYEHVLATAGQYLPAPPARGRPGGAGRAAAGARHPPARPPDTVAE
ncbi:MAG TPA: helix-turn-helix domain-containing protein [Natronosporangium sp.]